MNEKTMPTVQLPGFSAVPVTIVPILEMAIGPHKGRWGMGAIFCAAYLAVLAPVFLGNRTAWMLCRTPP